LGRIKGKKKGMPMKTKKLKTMIIICIILIILLLIGGFVYTYFFTDMWKNNKQLFFQYAGQMITSENEETANEWDNYFEKKNTIAYTDQGSFKTKVKMPGMEQELKGINDLSINFNGKANVSKNQSEQTIKIAYTPNVVFPFTYRQDNDKFGLQTDYIGKKYITVQNKNLPDLCKKLGLNSEGIPNKIEWITANSQTSNGIVFTEEEKQQLINRYQPILDEQLPVELFTKNKTDDKTMYSLTLTSDKIKSLLVALLTSAKEDQMLLSKINNFLDEIQSVEKASKGTSSQNNNLMKIEASDIEEIINQISKQTIPDLTINVIKQANSSIQMVIENEDFSITFTTQNTAEKMTYEAKINVKQKENTAEIVLAAQFQNQGNWEKVTENYTVQIAMTSNGHEVGYHYQLENTISFDSSTTIDSLTKENTMLLNELESEQLQNFLTAAGNRIMEINRSQMEELGLEESENPLLYVNPVTGLGLMLYNQTSSSMTNNSSDELDQSDQLNEVGKTAFNQKFQKYEGRIKGFLVKSMIQEVNQNNENFDSPYIINVYYHDEIVDNEAEINASRTYTVTLEKDEQEGVVDAIILTD
jgi:hypothetical protein